MVDPTNNQKYHNLAPINNIYLARRGEVERQRERDVYYLRGRGEKRGGGEARI